MNYLSIQSEVRSLQETIRNANKRLDELRKLCKHENTFIGNYEIQRPTILQCAICADCCSPVDNSLQEKWREQDEKTTYLHIMGNKE